MEARPLIQVFGKIVNKGVALPEKVWHMTREMTGIQSWSQNFTRNKVVTASSEESHESLEYSELLAWLKLSWAG